MFFWDGILTNNLFCYISADRSAKIATQFLHFGLNLKQHEICFLSAIRSSNMVWHVVLAQWFK